MGENRLRELGKVKRAWFGLCPDRGFVTFSIDFEFGGSGQSFCNIVLAWPDLCAYQRWVLRHLYRTVPWPEYARDGGADRRITGDARRESDAAWNRVIGTAPVTPGARGVA